VSISFLMQRNQVVSLLSLVINLYCKLRNKQYFKYAEVSEDENITETKLITQNKQKKTKKLASWRQTGWLFTSVVED